MVGHCFYTLGEISRCWCRKRISMPALFISTNSHDANFEKIMLCMLDTWWKHVYLVAPACTHFHLQGVWQVQEVWQSQVNPCNVHVCLLCILYILYFTVSRKCGKQMSAGRTWLSPSNIFSNLFNTTFVKTSWPCLSQNLWVGLWGSWWMLIFCTGWRTVVVMGGEEAKILEAARGQGPPWQGGRNCIHPPTPSSLCKCKPPKIAIVRIVAIVDPACIPQLILPAGCWVKHFCFHTLHCKQVACMFVIGVHFFVSKYLDTEPKEPNQAQLW